MKIYRTGRHWGVTVVEEDSDGLPPRLIATAQSTADAERLIVALNLLEQAGQPEEPSVIHLSPEAASEFRAFLERAIRP
ncbi:MAG: hypothetical protein REI11_11685 [Patulibacter sp.]|nr:hypothetical protein [Patulibacter sp.]